MSFAHGTFTSARDAGAWEEVTIEDGEITITSSLVIVDTEGGAGTDTLETINGRGIGDTLILVSADPSTKVVTVSDVGNLLLKTGGPLDFDTEGDAMMFVRFDADTWYEIGRSPKA